MRALQFQRFTFAGGSRRGSVILFVLGVILLTAFLLTRLVDRASGELIAETKAASRAALRDEAYSSLEVTLGVLADVIAIDGALHAPQQGWADPLAYSGYVPISGFDVEILFQDESGKIPLATVDAIVLRHYLETAGMSPIEAERLTDALLTWTKEGYLPGSSESDPRNYENAPLPYAPPYRALRSFEELRAIAVARDVFFDETGQWTELGTEFRTDMSLHAFERVNVNSASASVLMGLGLDRNQAKGVVDELTPAKDTRGDMPKYYRSLAEAAAENGTALTQLDLGAEIQCLRVKVIVRQGARVFSLEAVVKPGNTSGASNVAGANGAAPADSETTPVDPRPLTLKRIDYPFRILELRESDGTAY